jgi:hypothetical protein
MYATPLPSTDLLTSHGIVKLPGVGQNGVMHTNTSTNAVFVFHL